jgi:hypothetical protein
MSTGRWSELSAEQEVRATEEGRSLVITMLRTSGVASIGRMQEKGVLLFIVCYFYPNRWSMKEEGEHARRSRAPFSYLQPLTQLMEHERDGGACKRKERSYV